MKHESQSWPMFSSSTLIIPLKKLGENTLRNPPDELFTGRKRIEQRLKHAILSAIKGNGGSFLVGGYRGVGKTKLVDKVIGDLENKKHRPLHKNNLHIKYIDLGINKQLTTDAILNELSEITLNIAKQAARAPLVSLSKIIRPRTFAYLLPLLLLLHAAPTLELLLSTSFALQNYPLEPKVLAYITLISFFTLLTASHLLNKKLNTLTRAIELTNRIRYSRTSEDMESIKPKNIGLEKKRTLTERPLSTREKLKEIQNIIKKINKPKSRWSLGKRNRTIFIFDEIDKISSSPFEPQKHNSNEKKEQIDEILADLKPLLSKSEGVFIFISGRDVVDAYHSESGYTSMLYESVFDQIFYVPSLLSDHTDGKTDKINSMISDYVDKILIEYSPTEKEKNQGDKVGATHLYSLAHKNYLQETANETLSETQGKTHYKTFRDLRIESTTGNHAPKYKKYLYPKTNSKKPENNTEDKDKKNIESDRIDQFKTEIHRIANKNKDIETSDKDQIIDHHSRIHDSNLKLTRRMLIRFLTLHSRGNFKRMITILTQFLYHWDDKTTETLQKGAPYRNTELYIFGGRLQKGDSYFMFKKEDLQRLYVSSKLYSYFDFGVARRLSQADDKLVVSSLVTMLDVVKFHSQGFSRSMLERTVTGIDIHADSSLASATNDFINSTFYSIIRRVSGGLFQYRFYLSSQVEFTLLNRVLGARASMFEHSLDAASPVKKHYSALLEKCESSGSTPEPTAKAKLKMILGDIYMSEKSYDLSFNSYTDAISLFKLTLQDGNGNWKSDGAPISNQSLLIQLFLKVGLLEEIRENYQQAMQFYSEAEQMSAVCFEPNYSNKTLPQPKLRKPSLNNFINTQPIELLESWGKSMDPHTSNSNTNALLFHSALAKEHLAIKQFGIKKGTILGNLTEYNKENTHFDFYAKAMTLHYFAGRHDVVIEKSVDLIFDINLYFSSRKKFKNSSSDSKPFKETEFLNQSQYRKANPFYCAFLLGHSLYAQVMGAIREKHIRTQSKNVDNQIIKPTLNLILAIAEKDYEESAEAPYHSEKKKYKEKLKKSNIEKDPFDPDLLEVAFYMMITSALGMSERGRYALSSEMYTSIVLCWIGLLELIPIELIDENTPSNKFVGQDRPLLKRPKWLQKVLLDVEKVTHEASDGAFLRERHTLFANVSADEDNDFNEHSTGLTSTLKMLFPSDDPLPSSGPDGASMKSTEYTKSLAIWYRSNTSNYLLIFSIWEAYSRKSIAKKIYKDINNINFDIDNLAPPFGAMAHVKALYYWIRARQIEADLKNDMENLDTNIDREKFKRNLVQPISKCLNCYMVALNMCKLAAESEDPETFPPKSIIYHNLFGAVLDLYHTYSEHQDFCRLKIREALSKNNQGFPKAYLEIGFLYKVVDKHKNDLIEVMNVSSNEYRREMSDRYYLYDDFEDPMIISEWSFLSGIRAGSKLHRDHATNKKLKFDKNKN